jgi:hypothetical protein
MNADDLLIEAYGRLPELVRAAVDGLSPDRLRWAPAPDANTVGWLGWHLTRVADTHLAELTGDEQVWDDAYAARFSLTADPADSGYGHTPEQVAAVRPDGADAVLDYFDAVYARMTAYLRGLRPEELDRVVDEDWDPPVTLGVRLISILDDAVQHAGQAAYVRGLGVPRS